MPDLVYTIKSGTVNGTTEFNDINAAATYFKAGNRMGAGTGTVSAGDRLDLVFEGFLDFGGSTQVLSGITLANTSTSRIRMRGGTNRWNASPTHAAGVTTARDGFRVNSSAQFTSSPGQPGLEIVDLVIAGGSTGNYLIHLYGSSSARGAITNCLIIIDTGAAMAHGVISSGYLDFRNNVVILSSAGTDTIAVRSGGFDDPNLYEHNTIVCLGTAPANSVGMRLDGSGHTARNNYVGGFAADYNGAGFTTASGNASSDATAPGSSALTLVARTTTNFESVTGNGDFRVKAASVLKTTGAARLAAALADAYGQSRADPATIGAHEAGATPPAPVLSSPSASGSGTGAVASVTTTGSDGTLYAVISAAQPSNTQIVAGQDSTGAASVAGSVAIASAGVKNITLSSVPVGPQTVWFLHRPAAGAGSDSNVVSAAWTQTPTFAVAGALDLVTSGLSFQQDNSVAINASLDPITSALAFGITPGIINITDKLAPGSGTPWVSRNDVTVRFVSEATGLTVLNLTNVTTDSQGFLPQFSNVAFQRGQWYEVTVRIPLTPPALGIWRYQAQ